MNKPVLSVVSLVILLVVGAYFYFSGKEYVVRITESEIREKLSEKLPLTKSYFFFIQITLKNPRIRLENGSDRINAGLDVL
jgi:hypothetical protein